MKLYCRNCKTKREITNVKEVYATKNYRIIEGKCSGCNIGIYKILEKGREDAGIVSEF